LSSLPPLLPESPPHDPSTNIANGTAQTQSFFDMTTSLIAVSHVGPSIDGSLGT
jgi:hypothetical protein